MTARVLLTTAIFAATVFGQTGRGSGKMEGSVHRAEHAATADDPISTRAIRTMPRLSRRVALRALTPDETRPVVRKPGLTPVGISRELPADVVSRGEWSNAPNGTRVWRVEITSAGAENVRLRFTNFHVGDGKVWLLGPDDAPVGPYSNDGPFGDGTFWTDMVSGDTLVIAYEPTATALGDVVPFTPAQISHRFRAAAAKSSARTADDIEAPTASAASCAVDVTCHPDYSEPASAVALMVFETGGESYQCTGSLISSASQPPVPFFLTANHCISAAEEARSLITIFNYQTPTCGGAAPRISTLPRVTGASLVAGEAMALGDFTLLRLTSFPNVDVKVLGWTSNPIASDERVTAISHPRGDYKRIAFGQRTRDVTIRFEGGERMPANKGYQVTWFEGLTQSGSSGSPLLATIDGKPYVVGTLTAGPDIDEDDSALVCRTRNLIASYGRFSEAFPYLQSFLGAVTLPAISASPSIIATPNPIMPALGQTTGRTTISWQAPGAEHVQIRVGSPSGPAMTGIEGSTGSAQTGDWVENGMTFYLQNVDNGNTIGTVTVRVGSAIKTASLSATPSTVRVGESTRLTWQTTGITRVQIRVGSPTGPPMTGFEGPTGSVTTGNWFISGLTFYLQDASEGNNSAGASKTLATTRVEVSRN
jgi:lysyl endopeptidase